MTRHPIAVFGATILSLAAAFFVFYEVRLLYVTRGLMAVRTGGNGTYLGAVAFPLLALLFGWGARRCWRASRDEAAAHGPEPAKSSP